jgi:hypothetical protein
MILYKINKTNIFIAEDAESSSFFLIYFGNLLQFC